MRVLIFLFAFVISAQAKDVMLVLTDQEQTALMQILDIATKAQGLQIANNTIHFMQQLQSAPAVVSHTDPTSDKKSEDKEPVQ